METLNNTIEAGKHGAVITRKQQITPFLWLDGNVRDAVDFYTSVFKNSEVVNMNALPDGVPGRKDKVISATFRLNGQEFMALDGGPLYSFTPAISFYVRCETQDEVDYYWEKLSAGGEEVQCGWLRDKFGLSWQVVPDILGQLLGGSDPVKSGNVMKAMLKMVKLDIAGLKQAYEEA